MTLTEEQRERLIDALCNDTLEMVRQDLLIGAQFLREMFAEGRTGFCEYSDHELIVEVEERAPHLLDEILGDSDEA